MLPAAQVAVNRQSFAPQVPRLTPPPARGVALVGPVVPPPKDWDLDRMAKFLAIGLDHFLHLTGQFWRGTKMATCSQTPAGVMSALDN